MEKVKPNIALISEKVRPNKRPFWEKVKPNAQFILKNSTPTATNEEAKFGAAKCSL
ncbi:MAG: hypothetical protein LBO71_05555 [Prevotellaceae bacterium]|jgi:hypothetical protein|nr:hypothetical protein [Prevotellaceae bacterium]